MITQRRLFHGWIVVATSAAGLFLGAFPIVAFSFGVFFQPFVREFHTGRGAISLAFTLHNLISGVCAVFVGRIADRVRSGRAASASDTSIVNSRNGIATAFPV